MDRMATAARRGGAGFQMSTRRTKMNLIMVSVSYLFNMSAYFSLEGLQSSLNSSTGTQSLSALYSSIVISALFLPSLMIDNLKCRKTMAMGTFTYALYSAANCYPRPYTLVPAAVILGAGSSVLWSSMRVYVSNLAYLFAKQKGREVAKTTSIFFGVFYAIFSLSMLVGNIFSSLVFQFSKHDKGDVTTDTTWTNTSMYPDIVTRGFDVTTLGPQSRCGLHNCDIETVDTTVPEDDQAGKVAVNQNILYIMFSLYAAMNVIAALILLIGADEVPNDVMHETNNNKDMSLSSLKSRNRAEDLAMEIVPATVDSENQEAESETVSISDSKGRCKQIVQDILATGKFMLTNHTAQLLIPITLHVGQLQAFTFGQFTKYWITCSLGIEYVGYIMSGFGVGSVIGGMLTGQLTRLISRRCIVIGAALIEIAMIVGVLTWEPEEANGIWIFVSISFCCGLLHSVHRTIQMIIYALFFTEDKEAASAALSFWDPLGTALAYAVSTALCNRTFICVLLTLLCFGTALYLVTEYQYAKRQRKRRDI